MCDVLDQSIDCLQDAKDSAALVTTGASSQGIKIMFNRALCAGETFV